MQTATYDVQESMPQRSHFSQVATILLFGIPMTMALAIAVAVYCAYECIKYALTDKRTKSISQACQPAESEMSSREEFFTAALTKFAEIHGETPDLETAGKPVSNIAAVGEPRADSTTDHS